MGHGLGDLPLDDIDYLFIENVGKAYKEVVGYAADFYVVDIGSGPCKL